MLDEIRRRLALPRPPDKEGAYLAATLQVVLLSIIGFALIYALVAPFLYKNPGPLLISAAVVVPWWLLALFFVRRGQRKLAAALFLSVLWFIVTFVSFIDGGVQSAATATYLTLIFATCLLLGPRAGLGIAGLSLAAGLVMLYAEVSGWLPPSFVVDTQTAAWVGLVTNIVLAAVLLYPASRTLMNAMEKSQRNERALAASEERYRTILESIEDGYYEVDLAGNLTFFNDALCKIIGYPRSELMGMNNRQYMDARNARAVYQTFNHVYRTGESSKGFDWELTGKTGSRRCVEGSATLVRGADGQPVGFRGIVRDVTERRRAEDALRHSEEWLRTVVEGTHALLVSVTPRGRFAYVNEAMARFVGHPAESLIGQLYLRYVHPEDRDRIGRAYLELVRTGSAVASLEFRTITASGEVRWVRFVSNPIFDGERVAGVMGVALDITDRVRTEQALRQSEERWRMYIEDANDLFFSLDTSGRFTAVNHMTCHVSGYRPEELLGQSALNLIAPEFHADSANLLSRLMQREEIDQAEIQAVTKEGKRISLEVRGRFLFDDEGEFMGTFHIARDITARKQAEESLRTWTQELEARNAELDAFAHTVAHDLQDPISLIMGYADFLAQEHAHLPTDELRNGLVSIEQSASKMSSIITELLLLAEIRKREVLCSPLDMGAIVAGACQRLASLSEELQAEIVTLERWPQALGYAPWVEEVWVNYVSNALKYGGRPPRVELGADVEPDGQVRFWVRDNGPGLSLEEQSRLFVPFTQLSQVRTKGYGLGLSIARRIVEKLGGQVGVSSEGGPGEGCVFSFTLPAAGDQVPGSASLNSMGQ